MFGQVAAIGDLPFVMDMTLLKATHPTPTKRVNTTIAVSAREVDEAWFADWRRQQVQFRDDSAA